ncbi:cobyrinate a,c-diamide synthase [Limnothrix sp. FACHB-1083]|uniref:cobyrinate a,c-diamide synthase n=1 Tax=unclassified Limnothrix TaxID=2632864 RepID=UPI001680E3EE|nr:MULTISPECIES: cobyrinate a,c-diamide synthase [unclassified Limnothrix]MBD2162416.1 cobyrinate a,c-diamide synthase [Limnothrix sp. FACHB-1083]MBD2193431.1 cobyrinate a,c-diamide synthase [Limnothrix sp. FACHB-1088]
MIPTVVVAGTHSGVGKTSVAIALMRAWTRRGWVVQPFKVGPDFIDPGHHRRATGRPSHNLDGWMLPKATNQALFDRAVAGADVAVIEGAMGLFDGYGDQEAGSTAELAKWLNAPVVLVLDGRGLSRSGAALIWGYETFDPDLRFLGAICNRVGSGAHLDRIAGAARDRVRMPILGGVPRDEAALIDRRHLGLKMADEDQLGEEYIDRLADLLETHLDLDQLWQRLQREQPTPKPEPRAPIAPIAVSRRSPRKIGIARDRAFCFYYEANLDFLRDRGAELVEFSPLVDRPPADCDALYLGGGYPELYLDQLANNTDCLIAIRQMAAAGKPIYGECGGFIYLCDRLTLADGTGRSLLGLLPLQIQMTRRPKLGYVEATIAPGGPLPSGETIRGHRFHYSEVANPEAAGAIAQCYDLLTSRGDRLTEGYCVGSVLGSYVHLHFASNPQVMTAWLDRIPNGFKL